MPRMAEKKQLRRKREEKVVAMGQEQGSWRSEDAEKKGRRQDLLEEHVKLSPALSSPIFVLSNWKTSIKLS